MCLSIEKVLEEISEDQPEMLCFIVFVHIFERKVSHFLLSYKFRNSPFRLTSLIYAEKFENPAIMEDKQFKQTAIFSVMWKGSDYFLLLDDKS